MMKATKTLRVVPAMIAAAGMLVVVAAGALADGMGGAPEKSAGITGVDYAPDYAPDYDVVVPAPQETISIHLGVKDPPGSALLDGWYCVPMTRGEGRKEQSDTLKDKIVGHLISVNIDEMEDVVVMAVKQEMLITKTNWPFNIAEKDKRVLNLNAPPGGQRVYKYYCYTKAELLKIQKTALTWFHALWDPDATGEVTAEEALQNWTGIH